MSQPTAADTASVPTAVVEYPAGGTAPAPTVVVEDPPPSAHYSGQRIFWAAALEQVKAAGGKWCRVTARSKGTASQMVRSMRDGKLGAGFEFCTRMDRAEKDPDKKCRVYARYVGTSS